MDLGFITLWTVAWIISVGAASQNETADLCIDHFVAFERVFAVPHEAALLTCDLMRYLDFLQTPYNMTWFDQRMGLELTGDEKHVVLRREFLLFFNVTTDQQGHYLCVVRTPEQCYKQVKALVVEEPESGLCHRTNTVLQEIQAHVNDNMRCPLEDYTKIVDSYSIRWYKGCELLHKGTKFIFTQDNFLLHVYNVSPSDAGFYTCRMTFSLNGVVSSVTQTIKCDIIGRSLKRAQMIEPTNNTVKASPGSPINKTCRLFLPAKGYHMASVDWIFKGEYVSQNTSRRIQQGPLKELQMDEGWLLERSLLVSEVLPDDLNLNFTCKVFTHKGNTFGFFTLQPTDPNLLLLIGLLSTSVVVLFISGLFLFKVFKVELALLFRTLFPFFYASTDGDGKLYDAYVVYPRVDGDMLSEAVEVFAMNTLPQVLEGCYGYRLFILGRDSLPGQAIPDVVDETLNLCRRLLLLYTSSSLSRAEGLSWFEQQAALHCALLDDSLSVMLLEMEQLSDPSILPESLRFLWNRQGALQAWKKQPSWRCTRMEDAAGQDETSLCSFTLSARFWRKVRYHMPVRSKAKRHSKRKLFLNL